jgi:insulysin
MLFLGTKNFPDPSGFDKFVAASRGSNNAYTADERTVYYTEVSVSASDEARSRFADFFRSPLFNNQYVSKEAHAIDSEHEKNVQDQDRRVFEILNSLSDPKSPVSRFKTGNIETLMTIPDKQNLDPVVELKSWFEMHYCPSRMRLATFGPESLEKLLKSANAAFGNISVGSSECKQQRKRWE